MGATAGGEVGVGVEVEGHVTMGATLGVEVGAGVAIGTSLLAGGSVGRPVRSSLSVVTDEGQPLPVGLLWRPRTKGHLSSSSGTPSASESRPCFAYRRESVKRKRGLVIASLENGMAPP